MLLTVARGVHSPFWTDAGWTGTRVVYWTTDHLGDSDPPALSPGAQRKLPWLGAVGCKAILVFDRAAEAAMFLRCTPQMLV